MIKKGLNKKTVLVVGGDSLFVHSIEVYLLENEHYFIETALQKKKALDILKGKKIDGVIIDVEDRGIDSIQFAIEMFNRNICKPMLVLKKNSIVNTWKEIETSDNLGVVEYLDKPINLEKLERNVAGVLQRFRQYLNSGSCIDFYIILMMLKIERKTGVMSIRSGKKEGWIFFTEGDIVDIEVPGFYPQDFFKRYLQKGQEKARIALQYKKHQREKRIDISLCELLPDHRGWEEGKENQTCQKEAKMAINEKVFEGLASISGFSAGAIYYGDGELVTQITNGEVDPSKMGGLAVELYKAAKTISGKMGIGETNFVEFHADDYSFVHTCIIPGVAALGLVIKKGGNIGLAKHEMVSLAKSLVKEFQT